MPSLKALPGRVILGFEKPKAQVGLIHVPETSQLRPEFGEIKDVGQALNEEQAQIAVRLRALQSEGKKIAVSFAAGVSFWRDFDRQTGGQYEWLKDFKAFRLEELAAFVVED